jgi:hypothetical protein
VRLSANTGGVASEAALKAKDICRVWAVDTACANFEEVEWLRKELQRRSFPIHLEGLHAVCVVLQSESPGGTGKDGVVAILVRPRGVAL